MAKTIDDLKSNYWMKGKIGSGGFGTVYLIRNRQTKEYFAAKQQPWSNYREKNYARREASILKKLLNPENKFVVQFADYFEGHNQSVILTEFLEGDELFRRISSSKYNLTQTKCRNFARQILNAIEFIHSRGIIHLDLKPENIVFQQNIPPKTSSFPGLIDSNHSKLCSALVANCSTIASIATEAPNNYEELKIIDLGLAHDLEGKNRIPINLCGTIEYISPEVMRCNHASKASDLWSIGVIFYMMVTGGLSPFWAGNDLLTQRMILRGQLANNGFDNKMFDKVPKSAIDCISRLLKINPKLRYTTSECLNHPWLTTDYLESAENVNTKALRKYLARRRWKKVIIAIKAFNRMIRLGLLVSVEKAIDSTMFLTNEKSDLNEVWI